MKKKNRLIFITNDDGYNADGIIVLKKINQPSFQDIWIFAPKYNQSAKSQSITINKEINFIKSRNQEYIIKGTPTDCVMIGLNKIFAKNKKVTLLLSGVNEGANLGYDLLYSGTFAAAREGCLNGVKSIAMSIDKGKNNINWKGLKYYAPKIINFIIKNKIPNNFFFNINFPNLSEKEIKGVKLVKCGYRKPGSIIKKIKNSYKIPSERKMMKDAKEGEEANFFIKKN